MGSVLITDVTVLDASGADPYPGEVLVQGNRIRSVAKGRNQIAREQAATTIDGQGMTLMPGMVEGHCHPSFTGVSMPFHLGMIPPEEHTLKTAANVKLLLQSGFTSIYCAASAKPRLDVVVRNAINAGELPGPRMRAASPELVATRHFVPRVYPFAFTNGIQGSYLEVDALTGFVTLLKHWVVEDCGTVINPQLVDEQIRGGVVQGIGGALFEEFIYDANGQLRNVNMADYLVPMAAEMPDIEVGHVVTPTAESELGAKGAGEAGTGGAPGAIMNAINDALVPFAVTLTTQPATPERILRALGKVD